jgi:hypothetical protein
MIFDEGLYIFIFILILEGWLAFIYQAKRKIFGCVAGKCWEKIWKFRNYFLFG